jgi:hypothetical protein
MLHEQSVLIPVEHGQLEARYAPLPQAKGIAVICHPHPLYGGTMNNKVVTTLVRTFHELNLATVRFNFRGVGASSGLYDRGEGEQEDCKAAIAWLQSQQDGPLWLAGFSFGAYVSAKVASELMPQQLISVAPPLTHFPIEQAERPQCPWLIVQGDADELIDPEFVLQWAKEANIPVVKMEGATHFFHGRLVELREHLVDYFKQ